MKETRGESNVLIWVVVIVVILLVLFFMFRGGKEAGDKKGGVAGPNGKLPVPDAIDNLEVELSDNPDIGVDDMNSLPVSQEEIAG